LAWQQHVLNYVRRRTTKPYQYVKPSRKDLRRRYPPHLSHEEIATLAYEFWQAQGSPEGGDLMNWLQAEEHLVSRAAV
jgi:hypothetical protein